MAKKQKKKKSKRFIAWKVLLIWVLINVAYLVGSLLYEMHDAKIEIAESKAQMETIIGENKEITGGDFNRDMAVVCDNGTFVGLEKNEVRSYRGIPYAEPPVGDLRWKPPVDAAPQGGVYEAYYYGKSAIQTEAETERASLYPQGEDCLTLNVFCSDAGTDAGTEAADAGAGKAVMVFLHGGAYGWGWGWGAG